MKITAHGQHFYMHMETICTDVWMRSVDCVHVDSTPKAGNPCAGSPRSVYARACAYLSLLNRTCGKLLRRLHVSAPCVHAHLFSPRWIEKWSIFTDARKHGLSNYTKPFCILDLFQTPIANTDVYKCSFFPQTISDRNVLPDSLISSAEVAEDCVAKFTSLVRARD